MCIVECWEWDWGVATGPVVRLWSWASQHACGWCIRLETAGFELSCGQAKVAIWVPGSLSSIFNVVGGGLCNGTFQCCSLVNTYLCVRVCFPKISLLQPVLMSHRYPISWVTFRWHACQFSGPVVSTVYIPVQEGATMTSGVLTTRAFLNVHKHFLLDMHTLVIY